MQNHPVFKRRFPKSLYEVAKIQVEDLNLKSSIVNHSLLSLNQNMVILNETFWE